VPTEELAKAERDGKINSISIELLLEGQVLITRHRSMLDAGGSKAKAAAQWWTRAFELVTKPGSSHTGGTGNVLISIRDNKHRDVSSKQGEMGDPLGEQEGAMYDSALLGGAVSPDFYTKSFAIREGRGNQRRVSGRGISPGKYSVV